MSQRIIQDQQLNIDRSIPWYKNDCILIGAWLFLLLIIFFDPSIYIMIWYYRQGDYYWFVLQLSLYYNFIILWVWTFLYFVIFIVFSVLYLLFTWGADGDKTCENLTLFMKESIFIPFKLCIKSYWMLGPLLGLTYWYPICHDLEFKNNTNEKFRMRLYVTFMYEMIKSGGSIVLQIYSLREGSEIAVVWVSISIFLNVILFVKTKISILYITYSLANMSYITPCRRVVQYCIAIFEVFWIASTFLTFCRFGKFTAMLLYWIVLGFNIFYTILLRRKINADGSKAQEQPDLLTKDLNTDEDKLKNFLITLHDFLWLVCIRTFLIRRVEYFIYDIVQNLKIAALVVLWILMYMYNNNVEGLIAGVANSILLTLQITYSWLTCIDPLELEHKSDTDSELSHDVELKGNQNGYFDTRNYDNSRTRPDYTNEQINTYRANID